MYACMYVCMCCVLDLSSSSAVALLYRAFGATRSEAGHVDLPFRVRHRKQVRHSAGERDCTCMMFVLY